MLKMVVKKSNFDRANQADTFASGAEINFYRPVREPEEPDPETVDKSVLEALIAEAEAKELDGYTQESVNTLLKTLIVGHEVMDNADISQGMVDLTVNMIQAFSDFPPSHSWSAAIIVSFPSSSTAIKSNPIMVPLLEASCLAR
mgnify:CR=1 FL=1